MKSKPRLLRITTVPISLKLLLRGQLEYVQQQGFDVLAVSAPGPEVPALLHAGISHTAVNMTRKITPVRDFISLLRLIRVIRNFKPDIVHTHTPKAGLLGMIAAWWCNVPVRMHTVAGLPLMEARGIKRKILWLTEKITYQCATAIYPNSKGLKGFIESNFALARPTRLIGNGSTNGINAAEFSRTSVLQEKGKSIRQKFGVKDHDVVFSFVGRIVKDKGIGELVRAFREILESNRTQENFSKQYFLFLVGHFETDLDPLQQSDYDFLHKNPQVVLAGFQTDVRPWLLASDIFVFPSYREGFPNVVMQACCLAVPCIVSDINGCNEIIKHQVTGLIVPPKDSDSLLRAMQLLAVNQEKRTIFGEASSSFVADNFGQQFIWDQLLREYHYQMQP
jgi:glycosyltransferase involved in cell wall biosynthesis